MYFVMKEIEALCKIECLTLKSKRIWLVVERLQYKKGTPIFAKPDFKIVSKIQ